MIGLSRVMVTAGVNSLGVRMRQNIAAEAVVNTFNWPGGKQRVQLESDISVEDLADPSKSFRLILMAFINGEWREWCSTTFAGDPDAASLPGYPAQVQPTFQTSSVPPDGVPCEMRIIPVAGTPTAGCVVRGL